MNLKTWVQTPPRAPVRSFFFSKHHFYKKNICVYSTQVAHGLQFVFPPVRRQIINNYNDNTGQFFRWLKIPKTPS